MGKDILVVRLSKKHEIISEEELTLLSEQAAANHKDDYVIFFIQGENDTDRTEFEIIKNNG